MTARTRVHPRKTPKRARRPAPGLRAIAVAAALVIVVVTATVLFLRDTGALSSPPALAPTMKHVHGVGLDPGSNHVYAATHQGLFRLSSLEAPQQVADRAHDFMGFTILGPNHFLASGHPESEADGPSPSGLLETRNGGETWSLLSLAGQADFHVLQARHGQVYGYNSMTGALMVTSNMKDWDTRAALNLADFAVSPRDPDLLVATTEDGLLRSRDGGRSFAPMRGPRLLLISWADDGTIVGATPDGTVQLSTDQGNSWNAGGTLKGPPAALEAVSGNDIYTATDGAVWQSHDSGQTFSAVAGSKQPT